MFNIVYIYGLSYFFYVAMHRIKSLLLNCSDFKASIFKNGPFYKASDIFCMLSIIGRSKVHLGRFRLELGAKKAVNAEQLHLCAKSKVAPKQKQNGPSMIICLCLTLEKVQFILAANSLDITFILTLNLKSYCP